MKHRIALISFALLTSSMSHSAQSSGTAPVPSQLAQTALLASSGGHEPLIAQMVCSSVYKCFSTIGKCHIVATPADAKLSQSHISAVTGGSSIDSFFLHLDIYDTKTHSLLWALEEPIDGAFRGKTLDKNVNEAVPSVDNDLKLLGNGAVLGDPSAAPKPESSKTRLSDEKE
jgi:hypothetical protein